MAETSQSVQSMSPLAAGSIELVLDVQDPGSTSVFWREHFGFEVVNVEKAGTLLERRTAVSPHWPALRVTFAGVGPRIVSGNRIGSMRAIALGVDDLPGWIDRLQGKVRWRIAPPEDGSPCCAVSTTDPNGYLLELRGGLPGGCGCSGATP